MVRRPSGARLRAALRADRGLGACVAGVVAAVVLTAGIPLTSSAFTAGITTTGTTGAKARFVCADVFSAERRRQHAYFEFAFDEPAGATTARDSSDAQNTGTYAGTSAKDTGAPVACPNDGGGAYALDGTSSRVITSVQDGPVVTAFTEEVWFKASSGGKLMGYEIEQSGESSNYDKHLYIDANGLLRYGTDGNGVQTIASRASVLDGAWHLAVATTSARGGSVLYLDGAVEASDTTMVSGEDFSGYWRIGEGKLTGWTADPGRRYLTGSLRFAAAYPYVLTADEVASDWSIGRPGGTGPTATATPTATASPTATATASPVATATADPAASDSPAPSASASASPATGPKGGQATAQPVPVSPDISTTSDGT